MRVCQFRHSGRAINNRRMSREIQGASSLSSARRDLLWQLVETYAVEQVPSAMKDVQRERIRAGDREAAVARRHARAVTGDGRDVAVGVDAPHAAVAGIGEIQVACRVEREPDGLVDQRRGRRTAVTAETDKAAPDTVTVRSPAVRM